MTREKLLSLNAGEKVRLRSPHWPVICEVVTVREVGDVALAYVRNQRWPEGKCVEATPSMLDEVA
jgi:hypothetical protein